MSPFKSYLVNEELLDVKRPTQKLLQWHWTWVVEYNHFNVGQGWINFKYSTYYIV